MLQSACVCTGGRDEVEGETLMLVLFFLELNLLRQRWLQKSLITPLPSGQKMTSWGRQINLGKQVFEMIADQGYVGSFIFLLNPLLTLAAHPVAPAFARGERCCEAGGGAEDCRSALPLESSLSFNKALSTVTTRHVQRRGLDRGWLFRRRRNREDCTDL